MKLFVELDSMGMFHLDIHVSFLFIYDRLQHFINEVQLYLVIELIITHLLKVANNTLTLSSMTHMTQGHAWSKFIGQKIVHTPAVEVFYCMASIHYLQVEGWRITNGGKFRIP